MDHVLPELVEGAELPVRLNPGDPASSTSSSPACGGSPIDMSLQVVQAFRPFTMSPVLHVSLPHPPPRATSSSSGAHPDLPTDAIVKLYDRRCLTNMRADFDDGQLWSLDKEREYRRYLASVASGTVSPGDFDSPTYLWDNDVADGEFEAYLKRCADRAFESERAAYTRLRELQGKELPRCYGTVEWEVAIPAAGSEVGAICEVVPGLLLEYVSPLSLRTLVETWRTRENSTSTSRDVLRSLCAKAVAVVDRISDFDVLNEDVRLDNFLVREPFLVPPASASGRKDDVQDKHMLIEHPLVLIDLGQCRLRREDEGEEEWVQAKWSQDETGAVGFGLMGLVKEFVGEDVWTYQRSLRYYRPLEED